MALIESSNYRKREHDEQKAKEEYDSKIYSIDREIDAIFCQSTFQDYAFSDLIKSFNDDYLAFGGYHPPRHRDDYGFEGVVGTYSKTDWWGKWKSLINREHGAEAFNILAKKVEKSLTARDPLFHYMVRVSYGPRIREDGTKDEEINSITINARATPLPTHSLNTQATAPTPVIITPTEKSTIIDSSDYWENEDSYLDLDCRLEDYPSIPSSFLIEFELENYDRAFEYELDEDPDARVSESAAYWDDMNVIHHRALKRYRGKQDYLVEQMLGLQPGEMLYVDNPRDL